MMLHKNMNILKLLFFKEIWTSLKFPCSSLQLILCLLVQVPRPWTQHFVQFDPALVQFWTLCVSGGAFYAWRGCLYRPCAFCSASAEMSETVSCQLGYTLQNIFINKYQYFSKLWPAALQDIHTYQYTPAHGCLRGYSSFNASDSHSIHGCQKHITNHLSLRKVNLLMQINLFYTLLNKYIYSFNELFAHT